MAIDAEFRNSSMSRRNHNAPTRHRFLNCRGHALSPTIPRNDRVLKKISGCLHQALDGSMVYRRVKLDTVANTQLFGQRTARLQFGTITHHIEREIRVVRKHTRKRADGDLRCFLFNQAPYCQIRSWSLFSWRGFYRVDTAWHDEFLTTGYANGSEIAEQASRYRYNSINLLAQLSHLGDGLRVP